jgi:hypothetical protein
MTLSGTAQNGPATLLFFARRQAHLADERRRFTLSAQEIDLINPNTKTCPVFRSSVDADLTKRVYSRVPVLLEEARGAAGNSWGVRFMRMFDMANDSNLFRTAYQLIQAGAARSGPDWLLSDGASMVPLYEAKMLHLFDHRWSTYSGTETREVEVQQKSDPNYEVEPRYWISEAEIVTRLTAQDWHRKWLVGWRRISGIEKIRTIIESPFPRYGAGDSIFLMLFGKDIHPTKIAALVGAMSSLTVDYLARTKMGGVNLSYYIMAQVPILAPKTFNSVHISFILPRIIELTYTSHSLNCWADDLGYSGQPFGWDEGRRAQLRAELDAAYAHLYGLTRDELRYILDPTDIYGPGFPSETFRVLKEKEVRQYGEYRTAKLVLAAWDRMTTDGTFMGWSR